LSQAVKHRLGDVWASVSSATARTALADLAVLPSA